MRIVRACRQCGEPSVWTLSAGWGHDDERLDDDHVAEVVPPAKPGCCGGRDPYAAFRLRPSSEGSPSA